MSAWLHRQAPWLEPQACLPVLPRCPASTAPQHQPSLTHSAAHPPHNQGASHPGVTAASAVTVAQEMGLGLQVVWQPEWPCRGCQDDAPFVASWPDLFAEPQLRLVDTFPGWTLNWGLRGHR